MKTLYFVLLVFSFNVAGAQASMMDDVSLPYLDKLIEIGKAYYPKFKYTTAREKSAREAWEKTKVGVLDVLTISYVYLPGNYTTYDNAGSYNTSLNGYQVGLFLNVGSVLEKPSIIKGAKQDYIAAKMDKEVVDLDVEQEIRRRYFVYIQQTNIVKLKAKDLADASDMLKSIKYKFEKGEVTLDVYNQALLSLSTYSEEKITAESTLLIAKSSLEELLGTKLENIK